MNKKLTLSCDIVMQGVEYASVNFSLKKETGDDSWWRYGPLGSMKIVITNPEAFDLFKEGRLYDIEISESADKMTEIQNIQP